MPRSKVLAVLVLLGLGAVAEASPLRVTNGRTVNMVVAGHRQVAVGLTSRDGGWTLTLAPETTGVVELSDVTSGRPVGRKNVRIVAGAVRLPRSNFAADHAYAVKLRAVTGAVKEAIIYLYPPRNGGRVIFEAEDEPTGEGEIAINEKGVL